MTDLFLHIFNIGITAGWLAIAVLLLRLVMVRKVSRAAVFALWSLVGVRLLFPVSLESVLSLIPSAEPVPPTITTAPVPSVNVGIPVVDAVINPVISQTMTPKPEVSINPMQTVVAVGAAVWIAGIAVMLAYLLISYWYTCRRVRESLPLEKGIRCCEGLSSAFVIGLIRPRIYLPMELPAEDRPYVIAHERAHLQRGDHYWKLLGFLLLTVYWFNPLLWVSYVLMCKDIEFACDEKVIKTLGKDAKKPYAMALANCGLKRKLSYNINRCPLAFGESKTKERVKHVLNYKKPTLWASILAGVLIVITIVCFMTNPVSDAETDDPTTPPNGQETTGIGESAGNDSTNNSDIKIPAETELQIKQDFLEKYNFLTEELAIEDLSLRFFGDFHGAYVMYVDLQNFYDHIDFAIPVAGVVFCYETTQELRVWKDGEFYTLRTAYFAGVLTKEDLQSARDAHRRVYPEVYERDVDVPEEWLNIEMSSREFLLTEEEKEIKQAFLRECQARNQSPCTTLDDVEIQYYGRYGDAHVMKINCCGGYLLGGHCDIVAGIPFVYSTSQSLRVYCNGNFYTLQQAYESGLLNSQQLWMIRARYGIAL